MSIELGPCCSSSGGRSVSKALAAAPGGGGCVVGVCGTGLGPGVMPGVPGVPGAVGTPLGGILMGLTFSEVAEVAEAVSPLLDSLMMTSVENGAASKRPPSPSVSRADPSGSGRAPRPGC